MLTPSTKVSETHMHWLAADMRVPQSGTSFEIYAPYTLQISCLLHILYFQIANLKDNSCTSHERVFKWMSIKTQARKAEDEQGRGIDSCYLTKVDSAFHSLGGIVCALHGCHTLKFDFCNSNHPFILWHLILLRSVSLD